MGTRLNGKIAIVTGTASGIGPTIARHFALEGAKLIATDIDDAPAEALVAELREQGAEATFVHADLRIEDDVKALMETAVATYGGLTTLVNCAAFSPAVGGDKPLIDIDNETLAEALAINIYGLVWSCKYALPHLLASGNASIINLSSVVTDMGGPMFTAYPMTKGAMPALTRSLAKRYQTEGVRVNLVNIGTIRSERSASRVDDPEFRRKHRVEDRWPPQGPGTSDDVAYACVWLASDEAGYVTNGTIPVNGGVVA